MSEKFTNIAGGAFQGYVADQIKARKNFIEEYNNDRQNKHLLYFNNRNAWIRLTSNTNISPNHPISKKYGLSGDTLAKKYILQGGVIKQTQGNTAIETFGVNGAPSAPFAVPVTPRYENRAGLAPDGLYNMLPNKPLGFKPMPGMNSVDISSAGRLGTLVQTNIEFTCYDIEQLDIMDALYMKLGFSVVLEWGHTNYLNNDGDLIKKPLPLDVFSYDSKERLLEAIQIKKFTSGGNYDAMLGTISNFDWNINPDGSYSCKIKLVGAGEILDSLKINQVASNSPTNTKIDNIIEDANDDEKDKIIQNSQISDRNLSLLNKSLFEISQYSINTSNDAQINTIKTTDAGYRRVLNSIYKSNSYNFLEFNSDGNITGDNIAKKGNHFSLVSGLNKFNNREKIITEIPELNPSLFNTTVISYIIDNISPSDDISKGVQPQVYITLGHFLSLLTATGILYENTNNKTKPYIYLDFNDSLNYCSTFKGQLSLDPRVCLIPNNNSGGVRETKYDLYNIPKTQDEKIKDELFKNGWTDDIVSKHLINNGNQYLKTEEPQIRAKLMHILININYITDSLRAFRNSNDSGEVYFSEFLNNMLKEISKALGSFNDFRVIINDSSKCARLIDDNKSLSLKEWENKNAEEFEQYTEIPLLGNKSLVYDFSFSSKISPNLASMITIAAQAEPATLGKDSFAISNLSRGLQDRMITNRIPASSFPQPNKFDNIESIRLLDTHLKNIYQGSERTFRSNTFRINTGDIESSYNIYKELLSLYRTNADSKSKASTIIPLDFQLVLDGISGIIPQSAFTIPVNLLPSCYKTNDANPKTKIAFIIHSIDQIFDENKWKTKITGQTINIRFDPSDIIEPVSNRFDIFGPQLPESTNLIENTPTVTVTNSNLSKIIVSAGYPEGTIEYELALAIGTKEGWLPNANNGLGSRSFRNNNPGNLDLDNNARIYDSGVTLENNPFGSDRFAKFTTPENGVRALVEGKIKRWSKGNMPITLGNQQLINPSEKYLRGTTPSISQFIYTYAPPNENNTENYINTITSRLNQTFPNKGINRSTIINNLLA